jgi:integrase
VPLSQRAREELDRYLERNPRLGDVALFPAPEGGSQPIRRDLAGDWLVKAEKLAKLPKLAGGRWHPYRRLWATERKHLPPQDVAAAGGWGDTQALTLIYQKADPETVLEVVKAGG